MLLTNPGSPTVYGEFLYDHNHTIVEAWTRSMYLHNDFRAARSY
jgi:hypothetical protein